MNSAMKLAKSVILGFGLCCRPLVFDSLRVVVDRLVVLPQVAVSEPPAVPGWRVARIQVNRLRVFNNCFVVLAELGVREAPVVPSTRVLWLQLDSPGEISHSLVWLAKVVAVNYASVEPG